jgi:hypothetical protein
MRRKPPLFPRRSPPPRPPVVAARPTEVPETADTPKAQAKRCLNEGGHKLYR